MHAADDPRLWLEDVTGERAMDWVKSQNAATRSVLETRPEFAPLRERLAAIYNSNEKIPYVSKEGDFYYNLWTDAHHPRGLWRRTTPAEYRKKDPAWETVLDLDQLAATEKENWFWKGASVRYSDHRRALLFLSRGGGDSVVIREFDVADKAFVKDGFVIPEAKTEAAWRDADHVFVATDFGAGSLTDSGYARIVKSWARGTPLASAETVYESRKEDVGAAGYATDEPGYHREFVIREITTFTSESQILVDGKWVRVDIPADASLGTWHDQILVTLRSDWKTDQKTFPAGALLAMDWKRFLEGSRDFSTLFNPRPRVALAGYSTTRDFIVVNELDNVRNRLFRLAPLAHGAWQRVAIDAPEFGTVSLDGLEPESDDYMMSVTDFITPSSLYGGNLMTNERVLLKQLPSFFDATGLEVSQHEAVSRDGTRVPYFQVSRKGMPLDGAQPTILYGYGGFEISETPAYSAGFGAAWLEKGGVYVLANIRGGGEFGPSWHQTAIKENRQRAYDDFISVAQDLVARKVTSPRHLGIMGGSNGGLLMGVMITERPDLFGAVVCQQPLLDMKRYSHLLAGASWMGEYGDPDQPDQWAYISRYSPYQNTRADVAYPPILFTTSTRDDRVHPGHARKMAALLEEEHHDVLFFENIEGGHAAAANNEERAYMGALAFTFFGMKLR
jgi:prolyl oligopeptidase